MVPGHAGVKGNEMANALASEGSSTQFHGPEPYIPMPLSTTKRDISSLSNREHEKRWASILMLTI